MKGGFNNTHCIKSSRVRSYSGPHFSRIFPHSDWIRRILRISPYSVRMRENAGKMGTRITPNKDTFYAVTIIQIICERINLDEQGKKWNWISKTAVLLLKHAKVFARKCSIHFESSLLNVLKQSFRGVL